MLMYHSRLFRAGCLLLLICLLAACSSSSKPEATIEAFYQAAIKRDVDKAIEQLDTSDVSESELFQVKGKVQMMVGNMAETVERNDGLKQMEVLASEIDDDGEKASVKVKLVFNNGEENTDSFRLRQNNGKWKIIMGGR